MHAYHLFYIITTFEMVYIESRPHTKESSKAKAR